MRHISRLSRLRLDRALRRYQASNHGNFTEKRPNSVENKLSKSHKSLILLRATLTLLSGKLDSLVVGIKDAKMVFEGPKILQPIGLAALSFRVFSDIFPLEYEVLPDKLGLEPCYLAWDNLLRPAIEKAGFKPTKISPEQSTDYSFKATFYKDLDILVAERGKSNPFLHWSTDPDKKKQVLDLVNSYLGVFNELRSSSERMVSLSKLPLPDQNVHYAMTPDQLKTFVRGGKTVLLSGDTGTGKSTLAFHAARAVTTAHILKVSGSHLRKMHDGLLKEAIDSYKPGALIVDDLAPSDISDVLAVLDTIKSSNMPCIITLMASSDRLEDLSLPGLRPGRIERMFHIPTPNDAQAQSILEFYGLPSEKAKRLAKDNAFTGAFLKEMASRLLNSESEDDVLASLHFQRNITKA